MIQELVEMCGKVGFRMNTNNTKVMRNKFASQSPVNVTHNNVTACFEEVNEYVYLGRLLNHNNELEPELHRRRRAAWGRNYGRTQWQQLQPLAWLSRHLIQEEMPIRDRRSERNV
uniref:Uncharacterized protein n=1 Tax=Caenorhabditis japonica TaxID=281687 RepID=A0A8R1E8D7_CAEJA